MNEVTIKGEIVFVDEVREYGSNGFRKHQVVVETGDGKWANPVPVEFIKDTIKQNIRENLHCNNFKVTLENKQQHIILEYQKFNNKLEELVEYFLNCTTQVSEQLENQKLLDFLVIKND